MSVSAAHIQTIVQEVLKDKSINQTYRIVDRVSSYVGRFAFAIDASEQPRELSGIVKTIQSWKEDPNPTLQKAYVCFVQQLNTGEYQHEETNATMHQWVDKELEGADYWKVLRHLVEKDERFQEAAAKWKLLVAQYPEDMQELFDDKIEKFDDLFEVLKSFDYPFNIDLQSNLDELQEDPMGFLSTAVNKLIKKAKKAAKDENGEKQAKVGPRKKTQAQQDLFIAKRAEAIKDLKNSISRKEPWEKLYKDACRWRSASAMLGLDENWDDFGVERETDLFSPVVGSNGKYLVPKIDTLTTTSNETEIYSNFLNWQENKGGSFHQKTIFGTIEDQQIPLTILVKSDHHIEDHHYEKLFGMHADQEPSYIWLHTDIEYRDTIMQHIAGLYAKFQATQQKDEVIKLVAHMHWWFCHACPCARGSAAIMETISCALLEAKGMRAVPKEGILIDIEALSEPDEEAFVSRYATFYDQL